MKKYIAFFMLCLPVAASMEVSATGVCPASAADSSGRSAVYAASPSLSLSGDRNYVLKKKYTAKQAGNPVNTICYYDAFGRLSQTIEKEFTSGGQDAVYFNEYTRTQSLAKDAQWLPWIMQGNGSFNALTPSLKQSILSYHGDPAPFTTTYYEASPRNNPVAQYKPGYDTFTDEDHMTAEAPQEPNTEDDILRISPAENGYTACPDGCYLPGELTVSKLEDENGKEFFIYKDRFPKTVMSRAIGESGEFLDTYYIYNESGVSMVITPELVPFLKDQGYNMGAFDPEFTSFGYVYVYDEYDRITEKSAPEMDDWTFVIYNKAGQIVLYFTSGYLSENNFIYFTYDGSGKISGKSQVSTSLDAYLIRMRFYASSSSEKPGLWDIFTQDEFTYVGPYDGEVEINTGYEHPDPEKLYGTPTEKLPIHPGHPAEFSEGLNYSDWNCVKIGLVDSPYGSRYKGYYGSGELSASKSVDEDGRESFLFKDQLGREVLSRTIGNDGEYLDTYYLYDGLGNLAMVFPPELDSLLRCQIDIHVDDPKFEQYGYAYKYDPYNRVIERKLPGVDWVYQVYDKSDRLVLTQDGSQRSRNEWIYYVYDNLDRFVSQSLVKNSSSLSRSTLQSRYDAADFDNSYPVLGGSGNPYKPFSTSEFTLVSILSDERYGGYAYIPVLSNASAQLPARSNPIVFEIPAYLAFASVDDVVFDSDVDSRRIGLKVYDRQLILNPDNPSSVYVERAYYYDNKGRIIQTVERNPLGGISRTSLKYDFIGNILAQCESHQTSAGSSPDTKTTRFRYDHRSRLLSDSTVLNGGPAAVTYYTYNDMGQLAGKIYGGPNPVAQDVLKYNVQGWLTEQSGDRFGMALRYYNPQKPGTEPSYTGNITEWEWAHKGSDIADPLTNTYAFTYDSQSRLIDTRQYLDGLEVNQFVERNLSYDLNGNIKHLQRYEQGALKSNFAYAYTGNQLKTILDMPVPSSGARSFANFGRVDSIAVIRPDPIDPGIPIWPIDPVKPVDPIYPIDPIIPDFPGPGILVPPGTIAPTDPNPGGGIENPDVRPDEPEILRDSIYCGAEYIYDVNGNMLYDPMEGLNIRYNHLNLIEKVLRGDTIVAKYSYLSDGTKFSATDADGNGLCYLGSLVYSSQNGDLLLESAAFGEGRFVATTSGMLPTYHLTDHLGSVRAVVNNDGEVIERNDYYPFGMRWNTGELSDNRYRYNGKEEQEFAGLPYTDYGARMYAPITGRWFNVDPLAERRMGLSPYNFTQNNPIGRIDPTGMLDGDFLDENGKYLGNDGIDDGKVYVIKTTQKSFDSGVSSAGISKSAAKATGSFIKKNSGNTEAFQNNSIAYDNSVEIISDQNVRQDMVNIVNQDNGRGGTSDANNREYGGVLRNGKVIESPMGPVGNPKTDLNASITHPGVRNGDITFHSHPSGQIIESSVGKAGTTIGGSTITYQWGRAPSVHDVKGALGNEYVFSRGNGIVYIINKSGVVATIPQNRFVTPKK